VLSHHCGPKRAKLTILGCVGSIEVRLCGYDWLIAERAGHNAELFFLVMGMAEVGTKEISPDHYDLDSSVILERIASDRLRSLSSDGLK